MINYNFIHLRLHSAYSLLQGAVMIGELPKLCHSMAMPAISLTDSNNMFAALEFSETLAAAGIQPIIGCQIDCFYADFYGNEKTNKAAMQQLPAAMVLLAQNTTGYKNLMKLNSCLYLSKNDTAPLQVTFKQLQKHNEGLICLTGAAQGPVGQLLCDGLIDKAQAAMGMLANIFTNRLYIEIQRHVMPNSSYTANQQACEMNFLNLAYEMNLPLVATNDVHFVQKDMYAAHDALLCIADGTYVDQQDARRRLTPEHYLKSPNEMVALFSDIPEATANTVEIAQRCAFKIATHKPILPRFIDNEIEELKHAAYDGLQKRLKVIIPAASVSVYQKRLDFELKIIETMGFCGYFLIVADFVRWARKNKIPVGPGRGSGAGSLVAYVLTITDLDPLYFSLLFERFLNPDRVSIPDFDIDFCMDRREEVIRYVQKKYGRDRVAQIITFGALLSKAAVRDVGRVLQMPYSQVDRLAKLIPSEGMRPISIKKALKEEPEIAHQVANDKVIKRLMDYACQLEGLLRNAATHAAGIVIADRPLDCLVPLYRDSRSDMPATQFNMKWVEKAGLVKFDFLGLKTLTVIQGTLNLLSECKIDIDISTIDLADPKTYKLYGAAETVGIFQVESSGMMDALKRMQPNCIEDIVALVALYRPGPMENIRQYCDVKNNQRPRALMHSLIDYILDETQGIIVYQEQVMQIAQVMGGYSLGEADLLRRAMGKKIQSEMDRERPRFLAGAKNKGVDKYTAEHVWDLLNKFANYGFNKSHAAAYGVLSYQTAWLKANYPVEFIASVMNCDLHLTDKLGAYYREIIRMGIKVIAPSVNDSKALFGVRNGALIYGLGGLKNIGVEVVRAITDARRNIFFKDLFDFASRVDMRRLGKRALETLVRGGAFDCLHSNRRCVFESLDILLRYSTAALNDKQSLQGGLFGNVSESLPPPFLKSVKDWSPEERLNQEYAAVGFYISGHPLNKYAEILTRMKVMSLADLAKLKPSQPRMVKSAGVVIKRKRRRSSKGNHFEFIQLSDASGFCEVMAFSDILKPFSNLLQSEQSILVDIEANMNGEKLRLSMRKIKSLASFKMTFLQAKDVHPIKKNTKIVTIKHRLKIFVKDAKALDSIYKQLQNCNKTSKKLTVMPTIVHLVLFPIDLAVEVEIALPNSYHVSSKIKTALKNINGVLKLKKFSQSSSALVN